VRFPAAAGRKITNNNLSEGEDSMSFPNGTLLALSGTQAQYVVLDGQTCLIPNPPTETNLFTPAAINQMQTVTTAQFNSMPAGPPLTNGASLATAQSAPGEPIYLLSWGQRCWIVSPQVFAAYGFDNSKIQVNPGVNSIPQGLNVV
jgi:hypothetical protein